MAVKKIPVSEVEVGMFVSSLDRPWRETPFQFQGFPISGKAEIDQLNALCRDVYIVVPDKEAVPGTTHAVPQAQPSSHPKVSHKHYEVGVPARDEVLAVHGSHADTVGLLAEMNNILRKDKVLKLSMMKKSIATMVESIERNPDAYIWLTRIRKFDSYICRDALSASVWATAVGREMGLDRDKLNVLATGAMVMDIGKMALPETLLNKKDRLSDDEWTLMKSHVERGLHFLAEAEDVPADVLDIVRTHHERLDGSGYPAVLKGDDIPLLGQIAGLVDFYVSVTTARPYAQAMSSTEASYMLYQQQGRLFSESLAGCFMQAISTYPTGSLVELSSGEVGIVISQNPGLRLRPNVVLLLDPDKHPYDAYPVVSLADYTFGNTSRPVAVMKTLADGQYGIRVEELAL
jgi:HD-GYP domain-containing protein (c-di-GMP phosphodiesterase class II)